MWLSKLVSFGESSGFDLTTLRLHPAEYLIKLHDVQLSAETGVRESGECCLSQVELVTAIDEWLEKSSGLWLQLHLQTGF
jgi:hypothetical protein